ncbi:MAG: tetratricopeptide repeat protein [Planctomycetes bacterium]|nr:tetratricopeptide repeat protein [Planctomycetota bacterium]
MRNMRVCSLFLIAATHLALAAGESKLAVCPVSLTNPDGQALAIEKYDLRVAIHGPLALTEMEITFRNPQDRRIEGRFLYLLPAGATVSRFAKDVDGHLMEGEVVETQKARKVYQEILQTMRDPALLEQDQGNRFSAKVFPIAPNGSVRVLLSYSQVLPLTNNERKMMIPLAGLPKLAEFNFSGVVQYFSGESLGDDAAKVLSAQPMDGRFVRLSRHEKDFAPDRDLELTFKPAPDAPRLNILKAGNYQMTAYRADFAPAEEAQLTRDWVFYFDTSASGADMEARRVEAIKGLLKAAESASKFQGFAFDLDIAPLFTLNMRDTYDGPSLDNHASLLQRRHCLGATDLGKALKHIGETARATKEPARFVLVSDGIASWGKREIADVVAELGEWPAQHVLHALVLGHKQDAKMLNAIVARTNGRVVVLPLNDRMEASIAKTVAELTEPLGQTFEFYDEGAAWVYPKTFRDVRPGSEMVVFSELKDGANAKPGVVYPKGLGKTDVPLDATPADAPAFAPLLQREAVAALLDHLEKQEQAEKDAAKIAESRLKRTELSVKNRVLCPPLTSMLVLETEEDYARFGIARYGLLDILAVGAQGIEVMHRKPSPKLEEVIKHDLLEVKLRDQLGGKINLDLKDAPLKDALKTLADAAHVKIELSAELAKSDTAKEPVTLKADNAVAQKALERLLESEGLMQELKGDTILVKSAPHVANAFAAAPFSAAPAEPAKDAAPAEKPAPKETAALEMGTAEPEEADEQKEQEDGVTVHGHSAANPFLAAPAPAVLVPATEEELKRREMPTGGGPAVAQDQTPARRIVLANPTEAQKDAGSVELKIQDVQDLTQTIPDFPQPPGSRAPDNPPPAPPAPEQDKQAAAKPEIPEWVAAYKTGTAAEKLDALLAEVKAEPRERTHRNLYAQALDRAGKWDTLQAQCFEWLPFDPENPQVYEFLGKSAAALNDPDLALRAISSVAETSPNNAALLGRAGWVLLSVKKHAMAEALFREALKQRQDDANLYRGLAMSLWLDEKFEDAAKVYEEALGKTFDDRYGDVKRVLSEELGYVFRAWAKKTPGDADTLNARAQKLGLDVTRADALRVTLCWDTDANDVDLHIVDPKGEECFYSHLKNESGLELYSDQTQGLGPEVIRCEKALPGSYHIGVNYFNAGPMGVSRGVVVVFKPQGGIVALPTIVPFALVPDAVANKDMAHIAEVKF